jgi:hypothetical protein
MAQQANGDATKPPGKRHTVMGWLGHYGLPLAAGILTSTVPAGFFMILAGVFPVGIMA